VESVGLDSAHQITLGYVEFEPTAPLDYVRLVDEEHEHRRNRRRRGLQ